ncbi:phosphoenolpyruvate synthase, partial [bacterium]|nr:phosphoenolpyruvate synthase [bacterium]
MNQLGVTTANPFSGSSIIDSRSNFVGNVADLGGKASNLLWMSRNGFNVPPFFVLTAQWITNWCGSLISPLTEQLDINLPQSERAKLLEQIRDRIQAFSFSSSDLNELRTHLTYLQTSPGDMVAVRSSVSDEDSADASFAGQMDSFLFCKTQDDITSAIKQCVASSYSDRAIMYRIENQLSLSDIKGAVIIQSMINADTAGVLFTANPSTGNRKEMVVSACFGVGEGVVSGECDADEFKLDRDGNILKSTIATKTQQVIFNGTLGAGTQLSDVPHSQQTLPCLTENQLVDLAKTGRTIATLKGHPQDIEFAVSAGTLFLLQTRDITALPPFRSNDNRIVWDNSNIEESYAGITTPLTFSFARNAYRIAYESTARALNVSEAKLRLYEPRLSNLLGHIKGRVFYNINNWYFGITMLPSFSRNKADMERMMGLQDPVDFVENSKMSRMEMLMKLPGMIALLARFTSKFRRIESLTDAFIRRFDTLFAKIDRHRFHELELSELVDLTDYLETAFLRHWETPIINDFFVMMTNGKMHRLVKALDPDLEPMINHLLAGE